MKKVNPVFAGIFIVAALMLVAVGALLAYGNLINNAEPKVIRVTAKPAPTPDRLTRARAMFAEQAAAAEQTRAASPFTPTAAPTPTRKIKSMADLMTPAMERAMSNATSIVKSDQCGNVSCHSLFSVYVQDNRAAFRGQPCNSIESMGLQHSKGLILHHSQNPGKENEFATSMAAVIRATTDAGCSIDYMGK